MKKSVVVSGMGLGLGMLTIADQVRKEFGVDNETFHRLSTEAGRKYWQLLFRGMMVEQDHQLITVVVDYDRTVQQGVETGEYYHTNEVITDKNFSNQKSGKRSMEVLLFHRGKYESSQSLIEELDLLGWRPIILMELLAIGEQYPDLQTQFAIIALGQTVQPVYGPYEGLYVPELTCLDAKRRKLLLKSLNESYQNDRFAFIRKDSEV